MSGKLVPDQLDPLERPLPQLAVVLVAGGDGERQRVDQQVALRQAVRVAGIGHQPPGDAQLVLGRLGHAHFVDRQRDHGRAEASWPGMRRSFAAPSPSSKLIEFDDRLAAVQLQRGLDHRRLGAVDHQRRVHAAGEACDRPRSSSAISSRPTKAVQTSRLFDPSPTCSRPTDTQPSQSPRSLAARATSCCRSRCSARRSRSRRSPAAAASGRTGSRPTAPRHACAGPARAGTHPASAASRPAPSMWSVAGAAAPAHQVQPVLGDEPFHPARHLVRARADSVSARRPIPATRRSAGCSADRASSRPASGRARPSPAGRWRSSGRSAARRARAPPSPRPRCPGPTSSVPVVSTVTWTKIGVSAPPA